MMIAPEASRNHAIDIAKGIAIIAVVVAHAEMPGLLNRSIYLWHMPLFFLTAGYFFNAAATENDPWRFVVKRFKGLYVPFVKWSVFFLLIHNVLFHFGILNETYGNWTGGVTHPYTFQTMCKRFISIVFSMGGYDEFLAGAYWFFRGLLVASIAFMVAFLLTGGIKPIAGRPVARATVVCLAAWALAFWKVGQGWSITTLTQGGYRDMMGTVFFGLGFIYRQYEHRIGHSLWLSLAGIAIVLGAAWFHCAGMTLQPRVRDVATLVLTGTAGWFMVYNVAYKAVALPSRWWNWIATCGRLSLYIFIWHVAAYKVVSLLKVWWYGLDWHQIGCHMVIHDHHDDLFWVLYSIAGVGIPIAGYYLYFGYIKPAFQKLYKKKAA